MSVVPNCTRSPSRTIDGCVSRSPLRSVWFRLEASSSTKVPCGLRRRKACVREMEGSSSFSCASGRRPISISSSLDQEGRSNRSADEDEVGAPPDAVVVLAIGRGRGGFFGARRRDGNRGPRGRFRHATIIAIERANPQESVEGVTG